MRRGNLRFDEHRWTDYQFTRNSGLRPWDLRRESPKINWGEVLVAACVCFGLMSLIFFALQMVR